MCPRRKLGREDVHISFQEHQHPNSEAGSQVLGTPLIMSGLDHPPLTFDNLNSSTS